MTGLLELLAGVILGAICTHLLERRRHRARDTREARWREEARKAGIQQGRVLERLQPQINLSGLPAPTRDEVNR